MIILVKPMFTQSRSLPHPEIGPVLEKEIDHDSDIKVRLFVFVAQCKEQHVDIN